MKLFKQIYFLINPILTIIFILLIHRVFKIENFSIVVVIGVSLAYLLSPRVRIIEKQEGAVEQIKWLFFKKVINKKM